MALLQYKNVGISALAAAVPENRVVNLEYPTPFPAKEAQAVIDKIGVYERRFADDKTCSSDLCFAAANKLLEDNSINRSEIDVLVFVSQTPDYRMPATSLLLQDRLRLSSSTIAFDVNLACSGFIYGLSIVYSLLQQSGLRKALLLNGETRSKVYSSKDRPVAYLFGDAGSAALIEFDDRFGDSYFSLNSDGANAGLVMIPAGGYRKPSSPNTLKEKTVDEQGNIRSEEQGYMKGDSVFGLFAKAIPKDIKNVLQFSGVSIDEIDYFVFHQASKFMNNFLAKKLKLDKEKVPSCLYRFGNTSSVSIPLTISSELTNKLTGQTRVLLNAFGAGMTWATAVLQLNNCKVSELVEI